MTEELRQYQNSILYLKTQYKEETHIVTSLKKLI